jgi:CRISPR-associated protein Csb3
MQRELAASIRVRVDSTNPGQFFACCGLLELADRLWAGAEGWFEDGSFCLSAVSEAYSPGATLPSLIASVARTPLAATDPDDKASPIQIENPFNLRLDWWADKRSGGKRLKLWAGTMNNVRIARAMQHAIAEFPSPDEAILDAGCVAHDVSDPRKKVEPFYFDARRGNSARSLDLGFAPDALGMTTIAYPYVELLCLVGIQRVRPVPTSVVRVFEYHTWSSPLYPIGAACAACGLLNNPEGYRFEVGFRTDQQKHKAFMPATRIVRR